MPEEIKNKKHDVAGRSVGHWTLADQYLFMSDEIPSVVRHVVQTIF